MEKHKADSIANALAFPVAYIENDKRVVILQRLGYNNKPVYYATDNINAAAIISVDQLWTNDNDYPSLTGEAVEINVWDGGSVLSTHQELQNGPGTRVVMRDTDLPVSNHSTHIAGTMIATGIDADARGMAGRAIIKAWDLNDDIAEMASSAADGIVLSNHSYGPMCGWDYNAGNECWYWYGDPAISPVEDYEFGFYDQVSADLDYIAWNAPDYLIVKSAGNDRNDTPASSFVHYVWDGRWTLVNVEREPDGGTDGFDCLNPMAVAKNILTVGAVDDAKAMTAFSAFGPTDDGRIKPDVVANGYSVYSSIATSNNRYEVYNGTSMSAASASGSVALLHQLQKILQPGVTLKSSTVKAILIHTATEAGNSAGPDYSFGWGLLNIKEAADLISQNSENGGKSIYEGIISQGEIVSIPIETTSGPFLKVTLCWTDPAGLPSSPSLNPRTVKLVNDLDVKVENSLSLQSYLPWVLDVENPSMAAARGTNHTDNVEQVYIVNPGENNFNIKISHSGSLTGGSQSFSLIVSGSATPTGIFPPQNLSYSINESDILLNWNPPADGIPVSYIIYRNGEVLDGTRETSYNDESIILNNLYEYYITAVYDLNTEQIESVGTNRVTVFPQTSRPLPFHVDFEIAPSEVIIKNSEAGWQWGDSESLNCYYLDFSDNTTKFIGIDSYSAGEAVHVSDVATTIPLRLSDYDNIVLSFDYLLKTGIYDAIDELHVVYKLQEETQWHDLKNLESSFDWKYISIELPEEICKNRTQIGF
ncbi:MAG: S8 family serine peptidase, partial [Bacteroidales bacterium]|nr:S8 family serine peptidase [Bacteroidales bacterium]